MTFKVNDQDPIRVYVATSGQTVFSAPFEFTKITDLKVRRNGANLTYAASPSNADEYSVTGSATEGGGNITLGSPGASAGDQVIVWNDPAIERQTLFPLSGGFNIEQLNLELSSIMLILQSLRSTQDRALTVALGEDAPSFPALEELVGKGVRLAGSAGAGYSFEPVSFLQVAPDPIPVRTVPGAADTLVLSDAYGAVQFTSSSAVTLTIPPDSDVAFETMTFIECHQYGTGLVTIAPGAGVTVNSRDGALQSVGQYSMFGLRKIGPNEWLAGGDLT